MDRIRPLDSCRAGGDSSPSLRPRIRLRAKSPLCGSTIAGLTSPPHTGTWRLNPRVPGNSTAPNPGTAMVCQKTFRNHALADRAGQRRKLGLPTKEVGEGAGGLSPSLLLNLCRDEAGRFQGGFELLIGPGPASNPLPPRELSGRHAASGSASRRALGLEPGRLLMHGRAVLRGAGRPHRRETCARRWIVVVGGPNLPDPKAIWHRHHKTSRERGFLLDGMGAPAVVVMGAKTQERPPRGTSPIGMARPPRPRYNRWFARPGRPASTDLITGDRRAHRQVPNPTEATTMAQPLKVSCPYWLAWPGWWRMLHRQKAGTRSDLPGDSGRPN